MTEDLPGRDALRHALSEQTPLLTGPPIPDGLAVRIRRVLTVADEILDVLDGDEDLPAAREIVARTAAWTAERIGSYHRLPPGYAEQRIVDGGRSTLLTVIDELDLLGLTLDHAYDAAHRRDEQELTRQLRVVADTFPSRTDVAHLTTPAEPVVDEADARSVGAELGEDGIPRMPVPEQPDLNHEESR